MKFKRSTIYYIRYEDKVQSPTKESHSAGPSLPSLVAQADSNKGNGRLVALMPPNEEDGPSSIKREFSATRSLYLPKKKGHKNLVRVRTFSPRNEDWLLPNRKEEEMLG